MDTGGMLGDTPIVNLKLTPYHKYVKFYIGEYPHEYFKMELQNYKNSLKFSKKNNITRMFLTPTVKWIRPPS